MLAYNVEKYIEAAIDGVLNQQVDFPIELVIAEDCSTDRTRQICDSYAKRFPDVVRVLPSDVNRGISGNTARAFAACRGEYIAVCDSDDIWVDPTKLSRQVTFLDANPQCGAVYTDVEIILSDGTIPENDEYQNVRNKYRSGRIFSELLKDNFINNSTSVFRRSFLTNYEIDTDRRYTSYDYLLWLHIASQAEIWFMDERSTHYRRHPASASSSIAKLHINRQKTLKRIPEVLIQFEKCRPWQPSTEERVVMFRKLLSVLYRNEADLKTKWKILGLTPFYFPSVGALINIFGAKSRKRNIHADGNESRKQTKLNSQY
jgi:Glycosyltransferases involved in cell wall biogenesis